MKDVAARAAVSLGTVSNVLNRPDLVVAATRERVEGAMAELGFVRNASARQLRMGRSQTIGYVMLDASNPFFTDVSRGIEHSADTQEMSLFICNSAQQAARERKYLEQLVQQQVAGILLTPVDPDAGWIDAVADRGTPIVLVDRTRHDGRFCSVAVDDQLGGALAVEHLLERGHRRVAFIGGPVSLGQVEDRWSGARAAWEQSRLPADHLIRLDIGALTVEWGATAGQRLAGIPRGERPTAAFCANDMVALGLLQQAMRDGIGVPSDLAIVGYDDIEFAGAAAVPLTSVRQPRHRLGAQAATLLLDEIENPDHRHQAVVYKPGVVARESTANPRPKVVRRASDRGAHPPGDGTASEAEPR